MEVNSLDVSFDGELVVTGSQDKTAKLWRSSDLGLVATLTGHRRGIWATKFFLDGESLEPFIEDVHNKIGEGGCSNLCCIFC